MNDNQLLFLFNIFPWIVICIGFYAYHRSSLLDEAEVFKIFKDIINLNRLQTKKYAILADNVQLTRELFDALMIKQAAEVKKERDKELYHQIQTAVETKSLKQLHRALIKLSVKSEMWLNKLIVPNYGEIKKVDSTSWCVKDIIGVNHNLSGEDLVWELYRTLSDPNTGWVLPSYSSNEQELTRPFSVVFESGETIRVDAGSEEKAYRRAVDVRMKQGKYIHQTYKTHDGYYTSLMPFNAKVEEADYDQ